MRHACPAPYYPHQEPASLHHGSIPQDSTASVPSLGTFITSILLALSTALTMLIPLTLLSLLCTRSMLSILALMSLLLDRRTQLTHGSELQVPSSASLRLRRNESLPGGLHGVPLPEPPAAVDADRGNDEETYENCRASDHCCS